MTHTNTPFTSSICGKDIEISAETPEGHLSVAWIINYLGDETAIDDASFIIEACNSYDKLKEEIATLKFMGNSDQNQALYREYEKLCRIRNAAQKFLVMKPSCCAEEDIIEVIKDVARKILAGEGPNA